jgi:hypothetical protein
MPEVRDPALPLLRRTTMVDQFEVIANFQKWWAVWHVDTEARENGARTFFKSEQKARRESKRAGVGGEHACRCEPIWVLADEKGDLSRRLGLGDTPGNWAFDGVLISAEDEDEEIRERALKKLSPRERKALGIR